MYTSDSIPNTKDEPPSNSSLIPAINFHFWQPCNFKCKFCFAGFDDVKQSILPKGHLPKEDGLRLIRLIAEAGFEKVNFAGGEPTLCSWLPDLVIAASDYGLKTGIITNGYKLSPTYLDKFSHKLNWVGVSIDSLDPEVNKSAGRKLNGTFVPDAPFYENCCRVIREAGCRLKINTVVHAFNQDERIIDFVDAMQPERWKVMRVLPVDGQNDAYYEQLAISPEAFHNYLLNNIGNTIPIAEDHNNMRGSYLMLDPAGRFYDSTTGTHRYSQPVLEVGIRSALKAIRYSLDKFIERKGKYDW